MAPVQRKQGVNAGFSLAELLVVMAVIAVLAGLLLPALSRAQASAKQASCQNNLRQIGIAFHTFTLDHEGRLPMEISTNLGGSMEFDRQHLPADEFFSFSFRHFLALSNELQTPRILVCRADSRKGVASFGLLSDSNLSYWVNPVAKAGATASLLAGDRNVGKLAADEASPNGLFGWSRALHNRKGNLLYGDGHVVSARSFAFGEVDRPGDMTRLNLSDPLPNAFQSGSSTRTELPVSNPAQARPRSPGEGPGVQAGIDPQQPVKDQGQTLNPASPGDPKTKASDLKRNPPRAGNSSGLMISRQSRANVGQNPSVEVPGQMAGSRPPGPSRKPAPGTVLETEEEDPGAWTGSSAFIGFAQAGYLLSLLWAIILVLLDYLRRRANQRAKASTA